MDAIVFALLCKALSDSNRVKIVELLVNGEMCGCKLLDNLQITQPTLSHHMKILCDSGIVIGRKEGKWMHYSISAKGVQEFREMIGSYARCDCETDESVSCGCKDKK